MKKLLTYILPVLILLTVILIGFLEQPPTTLILTKNIHLNPAVERIISDKYIDEMECTKADIDQILRIANLYGIANPYIPVTGISTDYIMEVRREPNAFKIVYPHFAITESSRDALPSQYEEKKEIKLKIGDATWLKLQGQKTLFLTVDNVCFSISSAKPFSEKDLEKVAESLVQITN